MIDVARHITVEEVEAWVDSLDDNAVVGTGGSSTGCLGYNYLQAQGVDVSSFHNYTYYVIGEDASLLNDTRRVEPAAEKMFCEFDGEFYGRDAHVWQVKQLLEGMRA